MVKRLQVNIRNHRKTSPHFNTRPDTKLVQSDHDKQVMGEVSRDGLFEEPANSKLDPNHRQEKAQSIVRIYGNRAARRLIAHTSQRSSSKSEIFHQNVIQRAPPVAVAGAAASVAGVGSFAASLLPSGTDGFGLTNVNFRYTPSRSESLEEPQEVRVPILDLDSRKSFGNSWASIDLVLKFDGNNIISAYTEPREIQGYDAGMLGSEASVQFAAVAASSEDDPIAQTYLTFTGFNNPSGPGLQRFRGRILVSGNGQVVADYCELTTGEGYTDTSGSVCRIAFSKANALINVQRRPTKHSSKNHFDLNDNTANRINSRRGGGQSLDTSLQKQMGQAMGHDFSGVRVHTGGEADQFNQQLNAKAFTTGQDIFFRQGEYDPGSSSGKELLAHELTHVVQQSSGAVGGGSRMTVNPPGDAFEQEADAVARQVTHMSSEAAPTGADSSLQRQDIPEEEEELQMKAVQRQETPEEEEELQMKAVQRQETPEEEEELQMKAVQRQDMPEEEEALGE